MITLDNISLDYNEKHIFDHLYLNIEKGSKVVITGKSGLGKSSLFNLILGFAVPQQGRIIFDRVVVDSTTVWNVRQKIAFVDQDTSIGPGKTLDWLRRVFHFKANVSNGWPEKHIAELLAYFELGQDELQKNIADLSGGERQRVAIITSILLGRDIFLLDEITSALDAHLKEKTVDFFLHHDQWTVVTISHDSVWRARPEVRVFDLEEQSWSH